MDGAIEILGIATIAVIVIGGVLGTVEYKQNQKRGGFAMA